MPHETPKAFPHAGLTRSILGAAMRVQDDLGTGLLEKAYQLCLAHVLRRTGHRVAVEPSLDITYDGLLVPDAYRLDLLVDEIVIVEIKALEALNPRHKAQMLTYLRCKRSGPLSGAERLRSRSASDFGLIRDPPFAVSDQNRPHFGCGAKQSFEFIKTYKPLGCTYRTHQSALVHG